MSNIKKYLQFLCIITVCLNSTSIMSSEYYIPVPDTSAFSSPEMVENGTSLFKDISEFMKETIKNDRRLVVVPVIAAVGGLLYMERATISAYAQKQCDIIEQETKDYLERGINTNTSSFFLGKTMRMYLLRPLLIGIPTYLSYNQFYIAAALICCIGGRLLGFPVPGGLLGGTSLAAGWLQQGHAVTHQRLDEVQAAIEKSRRENEELHAAAKKELNEINIKVTALPMQLIAQKEEITKEIKEVETTMSKKMEVVGEQVKGVDKKVAEMGKKLTTQVEEIGKKVDLLNGIPGQILSLFGEVSAVKTQNVEIIKQKDALCAELKKVAQNFTVEKQTIESLVKGLAEATTISNQKLGIIESAQSLQAQHVDKLVKHATAQGDSLAALQKLLETIQGKQNQDAVEIVSKVNSLAQQTENNKIALQSLVQTLKNQENEKIAEIIAKIGLLQQEIEGNQKELNLLKVFEDSAMEGISSITKSLSVLSDNQDSMQKFLSNLSIKMDKSFEELDKKINDNKKEIQQEMASNQEELRAENEMLKKEIHNLSLLCNGFQGDIKTLLFQQLTTTETLRSMERKMEQLGLTLIDQNKTTQAMITSSVAASSPSLYMPIDLKEQTRQLDQDSPSGSQKKLTLIPSFSSGVAGAGGRFKADSPRQAGFLIRQKTNPNIKKTLASDLMKQITSTPSMDNLFQ